MIHTRFATITETDRGCVTRFVDGASYGAFPHDHEPHYAAVAHRLGYGADTKLYCIEHEHAHCLVAEEFGFPSRVTWALAHGLKPCPHEAAAEEALAMALQAYARANQHPFIEHIDWDALKCRLLLTDARDEGDLL